MDGQASVTSVVLVQAFGSHLNEHLTYTLATPTPHFTIGATSGVLKTTSLLFDRETQRKHMLLIQVSFFFVRILSH